MHLKNIGKKKKIIVARQIYFHTFILVDDTHMLMYIHSLR